MISPDGGRTLMATVPAAAGVFALAVGNVVGRFRQPRLSSYVLFGVLRHVAPNGRTFLWLTHGHGNADGPEVWHECFDCGGRGVRARRAS